MNPDNVLTGMYFYVENCKKNAHDKNCREGKINVELFCEVDRPSGRFTKNIRRVLFKWEINI